MTSLLYNKIPKRRRDTAEEREGRHGTRYTVKWCDVIRIMYWTVTYLHIDKHGYSDAMGERRWKCGVKNEEWTWMENAVGNCVVKFSDKIRWEMGVNDMV